MALRKSTPDGAAVLDKLYCTDNDGMMVDRDVCDEEEGERRRSGLEAERVRRGRLESHRYVLAGPRLARVDRSDPLQFVQTPPSVPGTSAR